MFARLARFTAATAFSTVIITGMVGCDPRTDTSPNPQPGSAPGAQLDSRGCVTAIVAQMKGAPDQSKPVVCNGFDDEQLQALAKDAVVVITGTPA